MSTNDLVAGEVVVGRYVLSRRLGEGAAGAVWLARDRRIGVDVALKLLRPEVVQVAGMLERFARESDVSARMLSPNIVKVLGGGVTEAASRTSCTRGSTARISRPSSRGRSACRSAT